MTTYTVDLPWPPKELRSNARVHWAAKADATARAKMNAKFLARQEIGRDTGHSPYQRLAFEYFPPNNHKRDCQNMPASLKAYIDGIADALGVDDNDFRVAFPEAFSDVVSGGLIRVTITPVTVQLGDVVAPIVGSINGGER